MKKLIAIAVLVAAGGWVAYGRWLAPAPRRACAHLHALCGGEARDADDDAKDCSEFFDAIRNNSGAADADKTATCVLDARSCPEAIGCTAGGAVKLGAGAARGFLDGLQKAMK